MNQRTECLHCGKRLDKATSAVYPYCARCWSKHKRFLLSESPPISMAIQPRRGRDFYGERLRRGFAMMSGGD
mgnify:CR=1 FL=1